MNDGISLPAPAIALLAVALATVPRATAQTDDAFAAQAAAFAYDAKAPLAVQERGVQKRGVASVHDLTFDARTGRDVAAYLVLPEGRGPFPGVLWAHWLGEPATTNRSQFLEEAVSLAGRGVVSLLVDAMWSVEGWYASRVPEEDYGNSIRQTIALRRAMDLLAARPEVDKARLGFVGHDYGGMYGMLMAGLDRRAKTYVYVAVAPSLLHWAFFARQPRSKADYLRQNATLELTDYLRQVKNASTLFQFATKDAYVSAADTKVVLDAASARKDEKVYEADHAMAVPQAAEDRASWLARELGLRPASGSPAPRSPRQMR
jgi:cephalosporin-C deacetylase-like acetyl esterase